MYDSSCRIVHSFAKLDKNLAQSRSDNPSMVARNEAAPGGGLRLEVTMRHGSPDAPRSHRRPIIRRRGQKSRIGLRVRRQEALRKRVAFDLLCADIGDQLVEMA